MKIIYFNTSSITWYIIFSSNDFKCFYIICRPNMGILAIIHDQSNFSFPQSYAKK